MQGINQIKVIIIMKSFPPAQQNLTSTKPAYRQVQKEEEKNWNEQEAPVENRSAIFNNFFENQYQLIKQPKQYMMFIGILGLIFLVLAIVTFILAMNVKNIDQQYAEGRICKQTDRADQKCSIRFRVQQDISGPVYLLYYVKNQYTNHRRFLSSFSADQKIGKAISVDIAEKQCGNFVFNKQMNKTSSWTGQKLNPNDIASLCGAKPLGYFNDTYALYTNTGKQIQIDQSNIYNGKAVNSNRGPNSQLNQWIDPTNQHFKLYMLDGSLMTKKRLWGVIHQGLPAGDYTLVADNAYQMVDMRIIKGVLLTTANILGGKSYFYCVTFLIFFLSCVGLLIFFRVKFAGYQKLRDHDKQCR